jgi:hypothetical protein
MKPKEQQQVLVIMENTGEAADAIRGYLQGKPLSDQHREALRWVRLRIAVTCHELRHDDVHTRYRLTQVERIFFLGASQRRLSTHAQHEVNFIDAILYRRVSGPDLDSSVYNLMSYLEDIRRECEIAEFTNTLPM